MSSNETQSSEVNDNVGDVKDGNTPPAVPLFQASRDGFNDRAWNDPPPALINTSGVTAVTGVIKSNRPKLTERVAFSLNPASPSQPQGNQNQSLNAAGPPPMSGFIPQGPPK